MNKPVVTLVTSADFPNLDEDNAGLPDALASRGIEPRIAVWNDPSVDWEAAGTCVVRSVKDYASQRDDFVKWAYSVPRLLNHPDVLNWNSDKHYMIELGKRGLPFVPTTWLESDAKLSKHQVHTRFPALGDFVIKPAVSSGARDIGRYTATFTESRMAAINHASMMLNEGRSVMIQRYLDQVDVHGEVSLIYLNGLVSHAIEKKAMLDPAERPHPSLQEEVVTLRQATKREWAWGEKARNAIHSYIQDRLGRDTLLLYNRIDLVPDGKDGFYCMEVSLTDASLYLALDDSLLDGFANAIAARVFW